MFHSSILPILKFLWIPGDSAHRCLFRPVLWRGDCRAGSVHIEVGQLEFADFRGYENWKDVAVSQTETLMKAVLANDVMIDAYKQGLPAKGKVFPDGVKIVKVEWSFKRNTVAPVFRQRPG